MPKYRGNNANACAILNGERKVGYTIHQVENCLDAGDIYYKYEYEIGPSETYYEAKLSMDNDIRLNLLDILSNILNKQKKGVSQIGEEFVYASKLKPEDGIIKDWNIKTDDIFNRFVVFSKPLGTGLKFNHNNKIFEITAISTIKGFAHSMGFFGAVVMKTDNGAIWVKTADTAISIDEIYYEDKPLIPSLVFKIGDRL